MQVGPGYSCRNSRHNGFSLIELMVVVAIIAILASIALPSYSHYVSESRAKGASSDLVALSLVYENDFQKTLVYPAYASGTSIAALPSNRSGTQITDFGAWSPAEGSYYNYTIYSTSSTYTVTATAVAGNCTLTLTAGNVRTATGNGCGFSTW